MIRVICLVLCVCLLTAAPLASADILRVAVASNFNAVLQELASGFSAASGHELRISAGSTGTHFAQISNGAPFDIFVAADLEHPAMLVNSGIALADSLLVYAQGSLLLWSVDPGLAVSGGKVLQDGNFRHLAIANPAQAPYGLAAREALESLTLWSSLQDKLVQGENITQTWQFVSTGNAELGFIAASQWFDRANRATGSVWEVPQALYSPILQAAVILHESPAARAFLAFMQSEAAIALITAAGYRIP